MLVSAIFMHRRAYAARISSGTLASRLAGTSLIPTALKALLISWKVGQATLVPRRLPTYPNMRFNDVEIRRSCSTALTPHSRRKLSVKYVFRSANGILP